MKNMLKKAKKLAAVYLFWKKHRSVEIIGCPSWLGILFKCRNGIDGYYSQHGQDHYIDTLLDDNVIHIDSRVFVDVGCNHPINYNNSYYFELHKQFKVYAIDAIAEMGTQWARLRPTAEFINSAVGEAQGVVKFSVHNKSCEASMFSSVVGASKKVGDAVTDIREVKVDRIGSLLKAREIYSVDILSIDIEGYEYEALLGIDFQEVDVGVIVVENNSSNYGLGSEEIRDLLISKGFVYRARFWNLDDVFVRPDRGDFIS